MELQYYNILYKFLTACKKYCTYCKHFEYIFKITEANFDISFYIYILYINVKISISLSPAVLKYLAFINKNLIVWKMILFILCHLGYNALLNDIDYDVTNSTLSSPCI